MDIPLVIVVVGWLRELQERAGESASVLPAWRPGRAARNGGDTHVGKDGIGETIDYWRATEKWTVCCFTPHFLVACEAGRNVIPITAKKVNQEANLLLETQ